MLDWVASLFNFNLISWFLLHAIKSEQNSFLVLLFCSFETIYNANNCWYCYFNDDIILLLVCKFNKILCFYFGCKKRVCSNKNSIRIWKEKKRKNQNILGECVVLLVSDYIICFCRKIYNILKCFKFQCVAK